MTIKRVLWVKACPDYEPLFSILDGFRLDSERRYWIEHQEAERNIKDIQVDTGQMSTGVEILLPMSAKTNACLERQALVLPYLDQRGDKSKIAQPSLSDSTLPTVY